MKSVQSALSLLEDAGFVQALAICDPSAGDLVRRLAQLIELGWSPADIENAADMGYNFTPHVKIGGRWNGKYGEGPRAFYDWVRHYYRRHKAEQLGMSLEDYIALWRRLAKDSAIRQSLLNRYMPSDRVVALYVLARRYGLDDFEIRRKLFLWYLHRAGSYMRLRQRFDQEFVEQLVHAVDTRPWRGLSEKYIIEALRRGASQEQVLESVEDDSIHHLALSLREAQRTQG